MYNEIGTDPTLFIKMEDFTSDTSVLHWNCIIRLTFLSI